MFRPDGRVAAGGSKSLAGGSKNVPRSGLAVAPPRTAPECFGASSASSNECQEVEAGRLVNDVEGDTPALPGRDGVLSLVVGGGDTEAALAEDGLSARSQNEPAVGGVLGGPEGPAEDRRPPGCLSSSFTRPATGLAVCITEGHRAKVNNLPT
jgi:hypothetical protein